MSENKTLITFLIYALFSGTGVLFHFRAAAFIDDVGLKGDGQYSTLEELSNDIDVKYETGAMNCWIGALIYLVTFCLSMQQFYQHEKVSILNDIKSLRYGSVENSS